MYNSNKLNEKYINIFTKYNIDKLYIEKLIDKIKNYNLITKRLINEFNLTNDILIEIDNIYTNDILFKDVIPFLEKYYKKYDLILLTFANDIKYQQKKIDSSNISKYFKDIIITTKSKSSLNNVDYINSIFIDNNPLELKKFYDSKANHIIRMKRETDKYSKLNLDIDNIPEFINFEELDNYIEKIGDDLYE